MITVRGNFNPIAPPPPTGVYYFTIVNKASQSGKGTYAFGYSEAREVTDGGAWECWAKPDAAYNNLSGATMVSQYAGDIMLTSAGFQYAFNRRRCMVEVTASIFNYYGTPTASYVVGANATKPDSFYTNIVNDYLYAVGII
jgi:hypothetical protein